MSVDGEKSHEHDDGNANADADADEGGFLGRPKYERARQLHASQKLLKFGTQRCRDLVMTGDSVFLSGCTERI